VHRANRSSLLPRLCRSRARVASLILDHVNRINHANNSRVDRNIFHPLGQPRTRSGNDENTLMKSGAHCVNCNHVAGGVAAVYIDRSHDQQLLSGQPFVFLRGDNSPEDASNDHSGYRSRPIGRVSSTLPCGRGITCTLTSSPTRRAAAAPASVAAFTAATSPRTIAVTKPAPIFS